MVENYKDYDKIARYYDQMDSYYENHVYSKMRKKYLPKIEHARILEIGIGTGKNIPYYSDTNYVHGIDKSKKMLEQAQKRLDKLKKQGLRTKVTLQKVNEIWELPHTSYDYIVATFVLCTIRNPEPIIEQIYERLDPEGELVLFEWIPPRSGIRSKLLKVAHPLLNYLFGVSVYRNPSINFFKKDAWSLEKKEYFDEENVVLKLKKLV